MYNRNKSSLCIDLKTPEGIATARDVIAASDIMIENFRPGAMEKLGLGYDALSDSNGEHEAWLQTIRAIRIGKIYLYERIDRERIHGSEGPAMLGAKPVSDRERSYPEESEEENDSGRDAGASNAVKNDEAEK